MSDTVIKVEHLSKQYRLGQVSTGTLSHDINRWWHTIRGKEDPYLKIGEANDRTTTGNSDYVWALQDINFEVKQGEVLGIIGRNGAGKSTLLKILSRTTAPTTGSIKIKGRVASLLEVGTGFHPELSGRENIFLNGAILGMTRNEIKRKFDEIVAFAGVERYIDTPVKRYSSGMYVRLAFAVAAHLESEILIVDEVLAVGDSEFQKKCLGKMNSLSKADGRTVLFVSHNMGTISDLCNTGLYLKFGSVEFNGSISDTINKYVYQKGNSVILLKKDSGDKTLIESVILEQSDISGTIFKYDEGIKVNFVIKQCFDFKRVNVLSFIVRDRLERAVFSAHLPLSNFEGVKQISAFIPSNTLLPGNYYLEPLIHIPNISVIDSFEEMLAFEIEDTGANAHSLYLNADLGKINVNIKWSGDD